VTFSGSVTKHRVGPPAAGTRRARTAMPTIARNTVIVDVDRPQIGAAQQFAPGTQSLVPPGGKGQYDGAQGRTGHEPRNVRTTVHGFDGPLAARADARDPRSRHPSRSLQLEVSWTARSSPAPCQPEPELRSSSGVDGLDDGVSR